MKRIRMIQMLGLLLLMLFGSTPAWATPPEFCCCSIPDDPFGQGCLTLVCTQENRALCELEYGGMWSEQSQCSPITGECESYTAITLSRFEAIKTPGKARITWQTETEVDNAGFNIYRTGEADGDYEKINTALIPAKGSAAQGAAYTFTDDTAEIWKTYYYKLEDIDLNGVSTLHGPVSATLRWFYGAGK